MIFLALSYYFLLTIALDVFRIGAVIVSTVMMGASAKKMYAAVERMAGDQTGVSMIDKYQAAVSTAKVAQALKDVRDAIKGRDAPYDGKAPFEGKEPFATDNLSASFVLRHAEDTYGSDAIHQFGMSDAEIRKAAAAFGSFDRDQDYKLQFSEFMTLCSELGVKLTQSEVGAAMSILDTRGSGEIEFDEFLAWWSGHAGSKLNEPEAKTRGAQGRWMSRCSQIYRVFGHPDIGRFGTVVTMDLTTRRQIFASGWRPVSQVDVPSSAFQHLDQID
eukprot:TRINITY_DN2662_c0_g2_i1.p1 TRINITY_DN2662_c0_g2~~TRINITY_DN2662_c0_g2_i1.p1  ORF type:complete len:274 (-),score=32.58 TRINITY_DN2662_c0_g2_i1:139-960(-)